ncbi:DUF4921 family protein [Dermatophilus congolensis]|uniref:DUF4921 family protein n=1 Tax=Dermatophilus congolensis TaxID=1863 RepID=UPI001C68AAB5|nr:DUF4921 family protein [Dermatophilus congolensis]
MRRRLRIFAGGYEVVIGRRHVTNAGKGVLAGSGTLSAQEHAAFMELTVRGVVDLYERIPVAGAPDAFWTWGVGYAARRGGCAGE